MSLTVTYYCKRHFTLTTLLSQLPFPISRRLIYRVGFSVRRYGTRSAD